jgi:DNA-binding MarR family transcriptional regulator
LNKALPLASSERLAEKEFALIQEISRHATHTQRSLSESVGLSLGSTNLLIQRLARKGYIKVTQLDWKRTQYLLTLRGMMEKTHKAYHYTLYTTRLFRQIQVNISTALLAEYKLGRRRFTIVADHEILELIRDTASGLALEGAEFLYLRLFAEVPPKTDLVLTATLETPPAGAPQRFVGIVDFDNIDFRLGQ